MNIPAPDSVPRASRGDGAGSGAGDGSAAAGPAGADGIGLVEYFTRQQRALDRDRLATYAALLGAAVEGEASTEFSYRALRAELAAAQHVSEHSVERELDLACAIDTRYPGLGEVLGAGLVSVAHVRVICDAGVVIGTGSGALLNHALYEAAVLPYAIEETPARLRSIAKRLAEEFAEVSLDERHAAARRLRRVEVHDCEDGMAELYAYLPAEVAYAIKDRLHQIAKTVWQAEPGAAPDSSGVATAGLLAGSGSGSAAEHDLPPARSLDEVRADTLAELLLNANPYTDMDLSDGAKARVAERGYFAHLQVLVPVEALQPGDQFPAGSSGSGSGSASGSGFYSDLDLTGRQRPVCELVGYGPIATLLAVEMLESSHNIYRVDVNAVGNVLAVERRHPSKRMKDLLRARDQRCRFVGCTRPAVRCDIDHTTDWQNGGPTSTTNLEHLCKGHHTLKHHSEWNPELDETGTLTWTSPSKRVYSDRPPGRRYGDPPGRPRTPSLRTGRTVRFTAESDAETGTDAEPSIHQAHPFGADFYKRLDSLDNPDSSDEHGTDASAGPSPF